jgi:transcriptional regulator with XRE-family HTH domain
MLETDSKLSVSTGIAALDATLGGLFWGDNVVWELDGGAAEPFYSAIARDTRAFDAMSFISIDRPMSLASQMAVIAAGPGTELPQAADLLREIQRLSHVPSRRLLLFDSLDNMVHIWGAHLTRGFFARCCPMLLEAGAIAYWAMSARETPAAVRDAVHSVTQCVLRVDERSVRIVKAEGREDGVTGSMLHWHEENGGPVMEPATINGRVAASLRSLRRARELSQNDLAQLAGVTTSAISQAERAERGLSLTTLSRLAAALGITIDDLVRGENPDLYRIGRWPDDPEHGLEETITLLGSAESELRIDLVRLAAREAGEPLIRQTGSGIVAVASGLVHVQVANQTPALRHGEVLVADSERVQGWRNLGQGEALLFWIVISQLDVARPHRSIV